MIPASVLASTGPKQGVGEMRERELERQSCLIRVVLESAPREFLLRQRLRQRQ